MTTDEIATSYDAWAASYDSDLNMTRDLDAEILRGLPGGIVRGDVLELGCGTGKNTVWLAERAKTVLAIDFSEGMLKVARERVPAANVQFGHHDIRETLPSDSQSIDFATADLVFEHVEIFGPVFAEVARVLRPDGRFHVCELHPYRQLQGSQALFLHAGAEPVFITSYQHRMSDFLNAALNAGLVLEAVREVVAAGESSARGPRLLSLTWRR